MTSETAPDPFGEARATFVDRVATEMETYETLFDTAEQRFI
jgi:hypothetical protein